MDFARCIPVLASLNIAESCKFYLQHLGFCEVVYQDDAYLIVRRDAMEVHFWLAGDAIHPQHTSCYVRGGQVAALYEEYVAGGVPGLSAFEDKPWGMREFHLKDLHGNLLRFGCDSDAGAPIA
jgi:hypothetical protein